VDLSLNEAEALSKKAARGAGFSWGMAEDCAQATRWLCRHDIDGCAYLAKLLAIIDSPGHGLQPLPTAIAQWSNLAPSRFDEFYYCPIVVGTRLIDSCPDIAQTESIIRLQRVATPELLMCFVSAMARRLDTMICMQLADVNVAITDGTRLAFLQDSQAQLVGIQRKEPVPDELILQLRFTPSPSQQATLAENKLQHRAYTQAKTLKILNDFASRSYAPATSSSRLVGAGAGLLDND